MNCKNISIENFHEKEEGHFVPCDNTCVLLRMFVSVVVAINSGIVQ